MGRLFEIMKALQLMHGVVLLVVAGIGIFGTFAIGRHIEEEAIDSWIRQAELDAAIATTTAQSWLAQSETIISGLALGFRDSLPVSNDDFENLVLGAEDWNSEFSLDAVAVVERVLGSLRVKKTEELGQPLSDATDPVKTVPESFVHMVVVNSTEAVGPLRPSVDLLTKPEMGIVVTTAQRVPEKAILGPAFSGPDGRLVSLVGVGLPADKRDTIIVGQVDLSEMINNIRSNYVPEGLKLRISERDSEARATTLLRPVFGALKAGNDTAHTVTVRVTRGQARWNYHWDVTSEYLGGAPTANATMVQIGGLIITILVVYSIGLLSFQNALVKSKVKDQTAELQHSQTLLRQSHDRLELLVDQRTSELMKALESEKTMKREANSANEAKSSFLAGMSHELRTPLNAIMGFSDMMRNSTLGPLGNDRYQQYANYIFESGTLLIDLVDEILDLSKVEAGKLELIDEKLDVTSQIAFSLRQLESAAEGAKVHLSADIPTVIPGLLGDERALIQMLNNVISNAIKFTPQNGKIVVAANVDDANRIVITVTDTGIGMSKSDVEKALQPFEQVDQTYSRRYQGTGLGLYLCAKLMDLFAGTLAVDSEVGVGTIVELRFPPARTI